MYNILHNISIYNSDKIKINDDKTEFFIITSPKAKFSANLQLKICQEIVLPFTFCKILEVMFDDHMQMDAQISPICRTTHFHNIGAIRNLLTDSAVELLIHSLVMSQLDYCNSLLNRVPGYKLKRIQRMQNIAAKIMSRCPYRDHITPVLESLHWQPVKYHILFKLLLTYKCLNGLGPGYLSCLVMPRKHWYELRPQHQVSYKFRRFDLSLMGKGALVSLLPQNGINYLLMLNQH